MGEYEDMASFASMFSNSNAGGKMPKKKSASARQKAKAKGMKGAAYIALGKPAGKKTKNSGGKSSSAKGSKSKGSGSKSSSSSSTSSKPKVSASTSSPYVTVASMKATEMKNKSFTSPYVSAGSRSAKPASKPASKPMSASSMKSTAAIALGNPRTTQVRAKPKKQSSSPTPFVRSLSGLPLK